MGFIEEGRQLIQDFVTPEIRSIDARLVAVEKRIESLEARTEKRFDSVEAKIDHVQSALEAKMERDHAQTEKHFDQIEKRFESLESKMERNYIDLMGALNRVENYTQLAERIARVESKLQNVA